jgi:hypothetical protein
MRPAAMVILMLVAGMSLAIGAATILSELWTGGLSAGIDSGASQRIASDAAAMLPWCRDRPADVIWPSRRTRDGILRWRSTVTPALGTSVETGWLLPPTAISS